MSVHDWVQGVIQTVTLALLLIIVFRKDRNR